MVERHGAVAAEEHAAAEGCRVAGDGAVADVEVGAVDAVGGDATAAAVLAVFPDTVELTTESTVSSAMMPPPIPAVLFETVDSLDGDGAGIVGADAAAVGGRVAVERAGADGGAGVVEATQVQAAADPAAALAPTLGQVVRERGAADRERRVEGERQGEPAADGGVVAGEGAAGERDGCAVGEALDHGAAALVVGRRVAGRGDARDVTEVVVWSPQTLKPPPSEPANPPVNVLSVTVTDGPPRRGSRHRRRQRGCR